MKLISILCALAILPSCQLITKGNDPQVEKKANYVNKVNSGAKKITAKYGHEYNLSGNVIAQYPDFNIKLLSTQTKGKVTICTYELSSKNGLEKDHIRCTTAKPVKKHLYISDMHFYYHSDSPGKINVYIPHILMAAHQPNKLF